MPIGMSEQVAFGLDEFYFSATPQKRKALFQTVDKKTD